MMNALHNFMIRLSAAGLFAFSIASSAQEATTTALEDVPPPPPMQSSENLDEADITIVQTESETRYEYRVGGVLRGIRVFPLIGPGYVMVDTDGDGHLERSSNPYDSGLLVSSWILFSW